MVHDDAIQSELTGITDGQLTFTNTPFVKAYRHQQESVTGIEVVMENQRRKVSTTRGGVMAEAAEA